MLKFPKLLTKTTAILICMTMVCSGCATTQADKSESSSVHKKAIVGGVTGATLGAAAGVGIAAVALGPLALIIAPAVVIGAGAAGALAGSASGAAVGEHFEKNKA